jgi:LacI family transcriptional regulator
MSTRLSVRDVAKELGVSIASVSKALNGNPGVGDDLRAKIVETAAKLGYQPNASARSLRMGRSNAVGCMVDTITNPLLAMIVDAMERRLTAAGYTLLLANSHHDRSKEREILTMFEDRGLDGAVVSTAFTYARKSSNPFANSKLPLVVIDRNIQCHGDMVRVDHRQGALDATRHLIALGHKRIAIFTADAALRPAIERLAGYRQAFAEAGLQVDDNHISSKGLPSVSGYDEMARILHTRRRPTALICTGTRVLSGALRAIHENGLSVPDDFSIVAIGEPALAEFFTPRMTLLRYDMEKMGEAAAELMLSRLELLGDLSPRRIDIDMPLEIGGSTAKAPD